MGLSDDNIVRLFALARPLLTTAILDVFTKFYRHMRLVLILTLQNTNSLFMVSILSHIPEFNGLLLVLCPVLEFLIVFLQSLLLGSDRFLRLLYFWLRQINLICDFLLALTDDFRLFLKLSISQNVTYLSLMLFLWLRIVLYLGVRLAEVSKLML